MPKRIIPLSDMKIQKAKSRGKNVTLFDGSSLFLMVTPTGGKLCHLKSATQSRTVVEGSF